MTNPFESVRVPDHIASKQDLNDFLGQLEEAAKFDDLIFTGGRSIIIKSGGRVHRVGNGEILEPSVADSIAEILGGGANIPSDLKAMKMIDDRYRFTHNEDAVYRYRTNLVATQTDEGQACRATLRAIRAEIPSLEFVRLSQNDFRFLIDGPGLVIISGETGSGKTTTLAAVIGALIRQSVTDDGIGDVIVNTYEEPIEFEYEELVKKTLTDCGLCSVEVFQHEIGTDIESFMVGTQNAFRSNPDIILLGEVRELATAKAAMLLSQSGHLVFITTHAKGVLNSINRLVQQFPPDQQPSVRMSLLCSTKAVISQQLIKTSTGRLPLREHLFIPENIQRKFARMNSMEAGTAYADFFTENGTTFLKCAQGFYDSGEIDAALLSKLQAREGLDA